MRYNTSTARRATFLALGASVLALATSPAMAQQADAEEEESENVILVTAQFREQNLQDTPLAITAVTAEMLEARSQTDLATVADSAPNVQIRPQTAAYGPSVTASIRGIGQNDFNPAYEPGVGIYIDDIYYPSLTGAIFDTLDLDRVEILRGPQGTLSGRNSIGGAVKMYSRMPNGDSSGMIEAGYGSRDEISLRAAADFALTSNLFMRISGVSKRQDGYVDQLDFGCVYPAGGPATFVNQAGQTVLRNPAGGEAARVFSDNCRVARLGGTNYQAGRAILRWEPSDSFDFTIIGDYTDDNRTGAGQVLLLTREKTSAAIIANTNSVGGLPIDNRFICGPFCNFQVDGHAADVFTGGGANGLAMSAVPGDNRITYRGWGLSGQGNLDITENLQLVSITGYREFDSHFTADGDISPAQTGYGINNLTNWSFSQELRLNMEVTDALFVTVGGYYFEQSSGYDSVQDLRYSAGNPLQFRQPDTVDADARAAFANVGWEILPDLNLNAGIRYTEETKDQHYFRYNLDGTVNRFLDPIGAAYGEGYNGPDTLDILPLTKPTGYVPPATPENVRALTGGVAQYEGDKIDWRVALDYRISDQFMVYASVATGFKGGGSNPRPFNAFQLLSFAPEELTAYEIGVKTDLLDRRLRLNVSAFQNEYNAIQTSVSPCPLPAELSAFATPSACRINGGDARIKGLEVELMAEPIDDFRIDGSISYINFQYQNVAAGTGILLTDPGTGMPEWKWSIGAQYRADLGDMGSLTPRIDVQYQAETFSGFDGTGVNRLAQYLPSFTTANARLTWRNVDEDLSIALEVTNLTDEYYFYSVFDQRNNNGGRIAAPARPREWALSVRKEF